LKVSKSSEIIKLSDKIFDIAIKKASDVFAKGGIAVIPTETVYGIAAPINSKQGIDKIFIAKGRPTDNPLIVHISKMEHLKLLTDDVNEISNKLIKHFWPGPLTIIFKARKEINRKITGGLDTIAVRMPDNLFTLKLIDTVGPLAAPSANISGKPSGTDISDIFEELNGKVDLIIDEGLSQHGLESTVINPLSSPPVILRKGSISKEMIEKLIGDVKFTDGYTPSISPGTKYKHYAPSIETVYIKKIESVDNFSFLIHSLLMKKRIGVINFGYQLDKVNNTIIENLSDNPYNAMKFFYRSLRKLEKLADIIVIMPLPEHTGLWISLEDRIERGANKIITSI